MLSCIAVFVVSKSIRRTQSQNGLYNACARVLMLYNSVQSICVYACCIDTAAVQMSQKEQVRYMVEQ